MFHGSQQFVRQAHGQADRQIGLGPLHSPAKMHIPAQKLLLLDSPGCVRVICANPGGYKSAQ
jgi:hypothetical protein